MQQARSPIQPQTPATAVGIYILVSTLWIAFSDYVLGSVVPEDAQQWVATVKGWLFVANTGTLYYFLLRRYWKRVSKADAELRQLKVALESAANAVVITDRNGAIEWINPAFVALTGYTAAEVLGKNPRILRSGRHPAAFYQQMWETVLSGRVWRGEMQNRRKDGTLYMEEMTVAPVLNATGDVTNLVAIKQDATQRWRVEDALAQLATRDRLTGLPNRSSLLQALRTAAVKARGPEACTLLLLDLDRFGAVNRAGGFQAGDALLVAVGGVLLRWAPAGAIVARLGNDEFGILLYGVTEEDAVERAREIQRLIQDLSAEVLPAGPVLSCTLAVQHITADADPETLLHTVEAALWETKNKGPGRVTAANAGGDPARTSEHFWAQRITDALQTNRLILHLQPITSAVTRKQVAYEVLARLEDEDGRLHMPASFMRAAEAFGLMSRVDEFVVRRAVERLQERPDLHLYVNLSGQTLSDEPLLERFEPLLRGVGLAVAERLTLEVTESILIRDLAGATAWMHRLRACGCRFAMDDFGAGFSSFGYIRALPVDVLKLDGSLIQNLPGGRAEEAIVQAMTALAHATGKVVVAEWVENEATLSYLTGLGVELVQGYWLGEPAPASAYLLTAE